MGDKWAKFDKKYQKKPGNLAYIAKKQYFCRRNWRSMASLPRNLHNCLNSSSPQKLKLFGDSNCK